jgi:DNA-binding transcriptional MerR regulator
VTTHLDINDAANLVNRSPATLRRYERAGIIPPARRDRSGHRWYTHEDVERIHRIIYSPPDSAAPVATS